MTHSTNILPIKTSVCNKCKFRIVLCCPRSLAACVLHAAPKCVTIHTLSRWTGCTDGSCQAVRSFFGWTFLATTIFLENRSFSLSDLIAEKCIPCSCCMKFGLGTDQNTKELQCNRSQNAVKEYFAANLSILPFPRC